MEAPLRIANFHNSKTDVLIAYNYTSHDESYKVSARILESIEVGMVSNKEVKIGWHASERQIKNR